jgi:hypothetical protein
VDLDAGKYVFVCNLVEDQPNGQVAVHYANGMAESFLIDQ